MTRNKKGAILLHIEGPDVQGIFETLTETTALAKLTEHFKPQKDISFECHNFQQVDQELGEMTDHFVPHLKCLVKSYEYDNPGDMIHDQIVDKCSSTHLQ